MHLSPLTALSPLDGRYASRMAALRPLLSEFGLMHRRVQVEVEWFIALSDAGFDEFKPKWIRRLTAHSPAERCSPRRASWSRRAPAISGVKPGIAASVLAAAVCNWTVAIPSARSIGPAASSTSCMRP